MRKIIVLSGAGISAESGIKTFRDSDGLWEQYNIYEVATPIAWQNNPQLVQEFYNARRKQIMNCEPNPAHYFFAEIENQVSVQIITQNIDDLHERAGSSNVLHLHGNIRLAKSSGPNQEKKYYPIDDWELKMDNLCDDGYPLRPHVVWFGEEVPMMDSAIELCREADVLVVIGTSLSVYPAASLIHFVPKNCKKIIVDPNYNGTHISNFEIIRASSVESIPMLRQFILQ